MGLLVDSHVLVFIIESRCNEVGFYQEGAPEDEPTLVTRLVQPAYDEVGSRDMTNLSTDVISVHFLASMHVLVPRTVQGH